MTEVDSKIDNKMDEIDKKIEESTSPLSNDTIDKIFNK